MDLKKLFKGDKEEFLESLKELFYDSVFFYDKEELASGKIDEFIDVYPLVSFQMSNRCFLSPKGIFLNTLNISNGDIAVGKSYVLYIGEFKSIEGFYLFLDILIGLREKESYFLSNIKYDEDVLRPFSFKNVYKQDYKFIFNRYFFNRMISFVKSVTYDFKVEKSDFNRFLSRIALDGSFIDGLGFDINYVLGLDSVKSKVVGLYSEGGDFYNFRIPNYLKKRVIRGDVGDVEEFVVNLYDRPFVEGDFIKDEVEVVGSDEVQVFKVSSSSRFIFSFGVNLRVLFRFLRLNGYNLRFSKSDITNIPSIVRSSYVSFHNYLSFLNECNLILFEKYKASDIIRVTKLMAILYGKLSRSKPSMKMRFYLPVKCKSLLSSVEFKERFLRYLKFVDFNTDELVFVLYGLYLPLFYNFLYGHNYRVVFNNNEFIESKLKLDVDKFIKLVDFVFLNYGQFFGEVYSAIPESISGSVFVDYSKFQVSSKTVLESYFKRMLRMFISDFSKISKL